MHTNVISYGIMRHPNPLPSTGEGRARRSQVECKKILTFVLVMPIRGKDEKKSTSDLTKLINILTLKWT
jgi:hypothetical protein